MAILRPWIPTILLYTTLVAGEYTHDPYVQYRPPFACSLPVQILLTGIVLTLVAVLFMHLMFTAQYHWPLAPVNYVLQLSGVTTLLISLIATIHVVLSSTLEESENWPYMLNYIAVNVPPPLDNEDDSNEWSMAERATWLVMNASTSGLIQITHIQFLTLLYPSRLEGRLIFALLGPLAVVAAVMQLVPISTDTNINNIASAVRNVCNATLSLLFTVALFIWGLLVNRKQAWRTDGGTVAFGAGALSLAVVSTALNFLFVNKEDEFVWLPGLMWAVVLWQSFLGWWWWVGAGSGSGLSSEEDLEDKLRREEKRESRRREARERRKETKSKARRAWRGVSGVFGHSSATHDPEETNLVKGRHRRATRRRSKSPERDDQLPSPTGSVDSTASVTSAISFTTLPRALPRFVHEWYGFIRREHVAAARKQAEERVQRIRELERNGQRRAPPAGSGWGLGSFGWRLPTHGTSGCGDDGATRTRSLSIPRLGRKRNTGPHEDEIELQDRPEESSSKERQESLQNDLCLSSISSSEDGDLDRRPSQREPPHASTSTLPRLEDIPSEQGSGDRERRRGALRINIPVSPPRIRRVSATASPPPRGPRTRQSTPERPTNSIWWWGPLARWRLQDSTTYHTSR
ncbi:hypothetical protein DFP72DRAFT_1060208 [Ephemerocybe angulata]|uniref:Uncharacterized protein n=1 Tax=Ephemerocybe angulata TaxID=980116 RepID=A0A8H6IEQ9_9AGAR|nr:hypothetical protein DFP72DRAFT_1060208 [Tulosesus angulatus]